MPLTPEKLSKIREKVPEYSGLSDDQLVARLMNDYPEIMGKSGVVDPRMQRAFGTGKREEKIRDVGGVVSGAGMVAGGLAGAASPIPGGAFAGSTIGGALGRGAEMKLYDWLGVKRPDEAKLFGLVSLGQSSLGKEMYAGALEGAATELLPMAVAGGARAAKYGMMSTFERAAKLPPNVAVAQTSAREGLGLGVDEITQSPSLRGVRAASAKTAAGATKAQMRSAEVEAKSVNAITRALSEIGPEGSPSAVAQSLRGEVGAPGVLGKIENQIRLETALKYSEIDQLTGGKPLVTPSNLKDVGKELVSRADIGLTGKGFGKTMRRSPIGRAIVGEAASVGDVSVPDIAKLTKGQFRQEDLTPEMLQQLRTLYTTSDKPLTLQEADALRSRYGEIARQARAKDKPDFRLAEAATRLKQAIDKDMTDAMDKLPAGSEVRQKYDEARKFVIEVRDRSFRGAVKYLSESAPSELAKSISVNDVETVNAIDKVLVKQGGKLPAKQASEASNAREAMRRIWTHDYFFGEGLPTSSELRTITNKARKLSPEFVDAMYGQTGKPREAFDRLVEIGRAVERVDFGLGTKGASQAEVSQALDIAGGAMIHGKYMAVRGLQRFATSHFLVKAVNDPKVYDMVIRGIYEYPKNPGRSVALLTQAMRTAYPATKLAIDATRD